MTTAFVLSGGASLAAVQVGMMQALAERHIHPELLVGTSAGALNAAYVAGHGQDASSLERPADLWLGMQRSTAFPVRAPRAVLAAFGLRESLCSPSRLAELLAQQLSFRRQDSLISLHRHRPGTERPHANPTLQAPPAQEARP